MAVFFEKKYNIASRELKEWFVIIRVRIAWTKLPDTHELINMAATVQHVALM